MGSSDELSQLAERVEADAMKAITEDFRVRTPGDRIQVLTQLWAALEHRLDQLTPPPELPEDVERKAARLNELRGEIHARQKERKALEADLFDHRKEAAHGIQ